MNERIEQLRTIYLENGKHCRQLEKLQQTKDESTQVLETARSRIASARLEVWAAIQKEVMEEWCNETETPQPFTLYPPKDMPSSSERERP